MIDGLLWHRAKKSLGTRTSRRSGTKSVKLRKEIPRARIRIMQRYQEMLKEGK